MCSFEDVDRVSKEEISKMKTVGSYNCPVYSKIYQKIINFEGEFFDERTKCDKHGQNVFQVLIKHFGYLTWIDMPEKCVTRKKEK